MAIEGGQIDWQAVRKRLESATASSPTHDPADAEATLTERAKSLARVPPEPVLASEVIEVIHFLLADARYAIETQFVREVFQPAAITPIPNTADFLVGVTNLRGEVLGVLDLSGFVARQQSERHSPWVLVLGEDRIEFGIVADSVAEVTTLRIEEIREMSKSAGEVDHKFIRGITSDVVVVLDGKALLDDPRLHIDDV